MEQWHLIPTAGKLFDPLPNVTQCPHSGKGNLYLDQIVYSYDPAPPAGTFREIIKLKLSKV